MIVLDKLEFALLVVISMWFGYLGFKLFGQFSINHDLYHKGYNEAINWMIKKTEQIKTGNVPDEK